MDADKRRTRFQERVRVEREFLAPINERFGQTAQLTGMTEAAIMSWSDRVVSLIGTEQAEALTSVLIEAARRAELLADNSRDVFIAERRISPDGLTALRTFLVERLALI